jgi:hypothetical protein
LRLAIRLNTLAAERRLTAATAARRALSNEELLRRAGLANSLTVRRDLGEERLRVGDTLMLKERDLDRDGERECEREPDLDRLWYNFHVYTPSLRFVDMYSRSSFPLATLPLHARVFAFAGGLFLFL